MDSGNIHIINFDYIWDQIEHKLIDLLHEYDSISKPDKDMIYLIGNYTLKYILKTITTCSISFDNTPSGLLTPTSTKRYPFVVFFVDYNNINLKKEILEYIQYDDFINILKKLIKDFNKITNNKIIELKLDSYHKSIIMKEETKTEFELEIKNEILKQVYVKNKRDLKTIKKLCKKYTVPLDTLKIRKIFS